MFICPICGVVGSGAFGLNPGMGQGMEQPKKPGFFGQGGPGRAIAGTIGDVLLQQSGMAPIYGPNMAAQQQSLAEQAAEQRKRAAEMADWRAKYDHERANPKPVAGTTFQRDYQYILDNFGPEKAKEYAANRINPPEYRQGADGRFYRIDVADTAPQVLGSTLPQGWTIEGGTAGNGGGGF